MLRFKPMLLVALPCALAGYSHAQAPAARDPGIDYVNMTPRDGSARDRARSTRACRRGRWCAPNRSRISTR